MRTKEARLDLCLVSLCLLFVLYYLAAMLPHPNLGYASGLRLSLAQVLLSYLKLDLGAWILVAFFVRRMYLVLQGRVAPSPYWDGLAIGGVAYFGAYLLLRMYAAYYLAPVDLIAVLYVGRSMVLAWREVSPQTKVVAVGLLLALFIQNVSLAAFRVYERKNVIHGKAEIARIIEAQFQKPAKPAGRLFFPFASPYVTMEYAAYLNYRGVPVEGGTQESAGRGRVAVVSRAAAKDSPCMGYTSLLCRNGQRPVPGDLVIVLPDDEANLADVKLYQDQAQPLFSYDPRPRMAPWLDALIRHFHIVSPHFSHKELPDRWLMASVTVWR